MVSSANLAELLLSWLANFRGPAATKAWWVFTAFFLYLSTGQFLTLAFLFNFLYPFCILHYRIVSKGFDILFLVWSMEIGWFFWVQRRRGIFGLAFFLSDLRECSPGDH